MRKVAIYGCGGFGREIAPLVKQHPGETSLVFVSDDAALIGSFQNGTRVVSFEELVEKYSDHSVVFAIASAEIRRKLADRCLSAGLKIGSVLAPTVRILDDVEIDSGAILCDFSMVTSNVRIGKNFHANIYSYVAHDCVIGDFVTLAPKACVNGNVILEDDVYIGTGAVLKQGTVDKPLRIGRGAVVGMGAVVTKDVPPGAVVIGNPARIKE